jgi:acid phosphatase class B
LDRGKIDMARTIKVGGAKHTVKKNKKGDVIVDHEAKAKAGKYDKINLTKKAGAKTIKAGERATRAWHRKNPHEGGK